MSPEVLAAIGGHAPRAAAPGPDFVARCAGIVNAFDAEEMRLMVEVSLAQSRLERLREEYAYAQRALRMLPPNLTGDAWA